MLGRVNQKATFNSDPNKQAQEAIFSYNMKTTSHPPLNFDNNSSTVSKYWVYIWTVNWTFMNIFKTCLRR